MWVLWRVSGTYHTSVVHQLKVRLVLPLFIWPGLLEVGRLPKVVVIELSFEGHVGGFWEHALLFEDGQDSQWLQGEGGIKRSELSLAIAHSRMADSLCR